MHCTQAFIRKWRSKVEKYDWTEGYDLMGTNSDGPFCSASSPCVHVFRDQGVPLGARLAPLQQSFMICVGALLILLVFSQLPRFYILELCVLNPPYCLYVSESSVHGAYTEAVFCRSMPFPDQHSQTDADDGTFSTVFLKGMVYILSSFRFKT